MMETPTDVSNLTPSVFLEAIRCLDAAINARLDRQDGEKTTLQRQKSDLRSAVGSRRHQQNVDEPTIEKVAVDVRVVFLKINSIDTIKDNYSAEILVQSKWREPKLDSKNNASVSDDNIDWSNYWNPKIIVDNVFGGEPADNAHISVVRNRSGQATVCESRRISGRFFELMELYQFPFDSQFLTVVLTSELDCSELKLVHDIEEPSGIGISAFSAEQEWKLAKDVTTWISSKVKANNNQKSRHPVFSAAATVSRRPQFFIWNIILMMFLTCSLSFATFTCNLSKPQFRLQLTFLLLLTTVTFKFAVNKILPKISYLTFLDKYILGSLIIQFCICVWHAVVGSVILDSTLPSVSASVAKYNTSYNSTFGNRTVTTAAPVNSDKPTDTATVADYIALGSLGGVYIVFQIVFLALIGTNTKKFIVRGETEDEHGGGK